jgi:hypothetical protein
MASSGLKAKIYSGSSSVLNTTFSSLVNTNSQYVGQVLIAPTDPNTSAAWTEAAINAVQVGVVNNTFDPVRVTAIYLSVEAEDPVFSYNQIGSGGVRTGSSAPVNYRIFIRGSGGIRAAGAGVASSFIRTTGGIRAAGAGVVNIAYTPALTTNGARVAGIANTRFYYFITWTGGAQAAGSASIANIIVGVGGARVAGSNINTYMPFGIFQGGIVVGSSAVARYTVNVLTNGGCSVGGSSPAINFTNTSGGIRGGSTARILGNYRPSITGGIRAGGTAFVRQFSFITWTGGVKGGGLSIGPGYQAFITPTGGIGVGGTAPVEVRIIGTGGSIAGGLGNTRYLSFITPTGGIVSGGSNVNNILSAAILPNGGVSGAGIAVVRKNYDFTTTGGILVDSTGLVTSRLKPTPTGGAITGSSALVVSRLKPTPTGGIHAGGISSIRINYSLFSGGGIRINGVSLISIDLIGTGGAITGGQTSPFIIIGTRGGAKVGGSAKVTSDFRIISLDGGVVPSGTGRISKRTNFTRVKTGIGRALAGDNILKPKLSKSLLLQPFGSETPIPPNGVRTQDQAEWNGITESNKNVLLPITIKQQRPYLPPKRRGTVVRNRQFATLTTS